jgi:hypothetical protein
MKNNMPIVKRLYSSDLPKINDLMQERGSDFTIINFNEQWVAYGLFYNNELVSIAFLFPYHRSPTNEYPHGQVAELGGLYTKENFRHRKFATIVVKTILSEVKNDFSNLDAIVADATDAGFATLSHFEPKISVDHRIWWDLNI